METPNPDRATRIATYLAKGRPPELPTGEPELTVPQQRKVDAKAWRRDKRAQDRAAKVTANREAKAALLTPEVLEAESLERTAQRDKAHEEKTEARYAERRAMMQDQQRSDDILFPITGGRNPLVYDEDDNLVGARPDLLGNSLWKLRRRPRGAHPTWATPQALWEDASDYFEWMADNPLIEHKVAQYKGFPVAMVLPKLRAMTVGSLVIYLGISRDAWQEYKLKDGFREVCRRIEDVMTTQKIEGAAADLLNSTIISRELGLKDRTDITSGDEPVNRIERVIIDNAEDREG